MTSKTTEDRDPAVETAAWVEEHGDFLFHFALRRLQNEDAAEEVLQQTLFAAFKARDQYKGDGVFRAWLTGILKRKIIDYFRARGRAFTSQLEEGPDITEQLFDKKGKWKSDPRIFGNSPGASIESEEFWLVFNGCLEKLPGKQGSVFFLREVDEESTDNICEALSISASNLWVLLHRARIALARCLKVNWDANLGDGVNA